MKTLFTILTLIPSLAYAQLPKPVSTLAQVSALYSSCPIVDTSFADNGDEEGHPIIKTLSFAPVEYNGIKGFVVVTFDAPGLASVASWHRRDVDTYSEDADFTVPLGGRRDNILDSIKSDATIEQFNSLVKSVPKTWGKPTIDHTTSKIEYYYFHKHITEGVILNQGALTVGWALK